MRNPYFFQKCHFCWNQNKVSKNDTTFERNEDCATVFLKWTDFNWIIILSVILGTYECQCHEGFKSTGKNQCGDIDECLFENGGCDHQCNNFVGSFQCSCHSGYHPSPDNLKMCVDIDECSNSNIDSQNSLKCSDKVEKI